MYAPAVHTELETLVGYVDQQLDAIRAAPFGLTESEARSTPCRSSLSLGGIVKHVTHGMAGTITVLTATEAPAAPSEQEFADYLAHFEVTVDESVADLLTAFDEVRGRYTETLRGLDPDADRMAPPAPWHGISSPQPMKARYLLWHQVEEFARHAGHADIIREQIDGTSVATLELTREGAPANAFFTPFAAAPGTLTT